mgnify:CR=1 FL=1
MAKGRPCKTTTIAFRRPLTPVSRSILLAAGCGVVALAVAGAWLLNSGPGNAVARAEKTNRDADGAFRPSETQWSSLRLVPVREVTFRDERMTDGKIASNEDTTTPVFSPYSGRIMRLIAKPGDKVELVVKLITSVAMEKGMRFAIREGGKTVGAGLVSEIIA